MGTKQVGEIIEAVKNAPTLSEKKRILYATRHNAIKELIAVNYGVAPFTALPDSEPPFEASPLPYPYNDARLFTAWKQYPLFRNNNAKKTVVEMRFIQLLESLHVDEARVLLDAHLGKLDLGVDVEFLNQLYGFNIAAPVVVTEPKPVKEPETPPPAPEPVPEVPPQNPADDETKPADPIPEADPKPKRGRGKKA